jgi:VWFA-related protein
MWSVRALLYGSILLFLFNNLTAPWADAQQAASGTPTIQVTSRLVFLDVTVLDRKGHPVVSGLTKDAFTITDDKKPQRIFSFEPPDSHIVDTSASADDPAGKAPVTIFVLDLLDSSFSDFAYIRYMVRKYLVAQPSQLNSPAELMVLGNQSLEMVQGYTRNKADLLYALDHLRSILPYKEMNGAFFAERFGQSIDALQQIALQNKGVSGRKNIVWVGHGGPNIYTVQLASSTLDQLNRYVHDTTNMLVDARVSLFVIYPGLKVAGPVFNLSQSSATTDIGDDDPFSGDINFGVFVNETGGKLFYNRNDINTEIKQSQELGSEYYTLIYQPTAGNADGKFRRIRVTLRDPSLRAMTKAGYFAPDEASAAADPRQQRMVDLSEAARSNIPFDTLGVTITDLVRHPDTNTAELTVLLASRNVDWQPTGDGRSTADLMLAAASLSGSRDFLATRVQGYTALANDQDHARLAKAVTRIPVTIRIPRKTQTVRVVIQLSNGRTGTAELNRKAIDDAPQAPTPEPKLIPQPQKPPAPQPPAQP